MLRVAPRRAYFELDDHPAPSVVYTLSLERHKKRIMPYGRKFRGDDDGVMDQNSSAKNKLSSGAMMKGDVFDRDSLDCSFVNSLIASAIGCGSPASDTLFGPFRSCEYPSSFRSSKVKNAMLAIARRYVVIENESRESIRPFGLCQSFSVEGKGTSDTEGMAVLLKGKIVLEIIS